MQPAKAVHVACAQKLRIYPNAVMVHETPSDKVSHERRVAAGLLSVLFFAASGG
jgi:hypothetical protein